LIAAMQERDADTGASRGWLMLTKARVAERLRHGGVSLAAAELPYA